MRRLMELAVKLYPLAWRQRYEAEFAALLEDVQPGWRAVLDICRGALAMQVRTLASPKRNCFNGACGFSGLIDWTNDGDEYSEAIRFGGGASGSSRLAQ